MSIATCYNRYRPLASDSGLLCIEVLSYYGNTLSNQCTMDYDCPVNFAVITAATIDTEASHVCEVYHYANCMISCVDKSRDWLCGVTAGERPDELPTIKIYGKEY